MKTGKLNKLKLKELRKILKSPYGLQPEVCGRRKFVTAKVRFEDHEDYLNRVSALLETAVLALDGNGEFYSRMLSNKSKQDSVRLTIEMAIELLPHDDLFNMRRLKAIIENDLEHPNYPKRLKEKIEKTEL
ncbi:hypothetical protein ACW6QP_05315 [Salegentibacter sp. HM20]